MKEYFEESNHRRQVGFLGIDVKNPKVDKRTRESSIDEIRIWPKGMMLVIDSYLIRDMGSKRKNEWGPPQISTPGYYGCIYQHDERFQVLIDELIWADDWEDVNDVCSAQLTWIGIDNSRAAQSILLILMESGKLSLPDVKIARKIREARFEEEEARHQAESKRRTEEYNLKMELQKEESK